MAPDDVPVWPIGKMRSCCNVHHVIFVTFPRLYFLKNPFDSVLRPVDGGFRTYPRDTVSRIRFIREAQELGFSLYEIEELLSLKSDPGSDCSLVRDRALKKRREVDVKIKLLNDIDKTLIALIEACPGKGSINFCAILNALDHDGRSIESPNSKPKPKKGRTSNGRQTKSRNL